MTAALSERWAMSGPFLGAARQGTAEMKSPKAAKLAIAAMANPILEIEPGVWSNNS
jgi:hypothetical protein